jgi:hypothetical protein
MPRKQLTMGVGAEITVLTRFLHPSAAIREKYINPVKGERLEKLIVVRSEEKIIRRKSVVAIVMTHSNFVKDGQPIELFAVPRYCKVTKEGPPESFFETAEAPEQEEEAVDVSDRIPEDALHGQADVDLVRATGINVDDDNDPAPENIPAESDPSNNVFSGWSAFNGICPRRASHAENVQPKLKNFPQNMVPSKLHQYNYSSHQ